MKLGADLRTRGEKAMKANVGDATAAAVERLELCFLGPDIDWTRFYNHKMNRWLWGAGINLFIRR